MFTFLILLFALTPLGPFDVIVLIRGKLAHIHFINMHAYIRIALIEEE